MPSVPSLEHFTRMGFAARGIQYLIIGYLALRFGRSEDIAGALEYLSEGFGSFLLAAMAVGLLSYGIWRLSEAVVDTEGKGSDAKGLAGRVGGGVSGLIHIGLSMIALNFALFESKLTGGGNQASEGAETALALPGGGSIVMLAGAPCSEPGCGRS